MGRCIFALIPLSGRNSGEIEMGLLLSFPAAGRKPLARRVTEIPREGADILFFTGIRYGQAIAPVASVPTVLIEHGQTT